MKGNIVVKANLCIGCRSCEMACAVEHSAGKELFLAIQEDPAPVRRISARQGEDVCTPEMCRQCVDAPCEAACKKEALYRDDERGIVFTREENCVGCKMCMKACPYNVINIVRLEAKQFAIHKCDMCAERLEHGKLPACVVACHTGALEFSCASEAEPTLKK